MVEVTEVGEEAVEVWLEVGDTTAEERESELCSTCETSAWDDGGADDSGGEEKADGRRDSDCDKDDNE